MHNAFLEKNKSRFILQQTRFWVIFLNLYSNRLYINSFTTMYVCSVHKFIVQCCTTYCKKEIQSERWEKASHILARCYISAKLSNSYKISRANITATHRSTTQQERYSSNLWFHFILSAPLTFSLRLRWFIHQNHQVSKGDSTRAQLWLT